MFYRQLGRTKLNVSEVGFGAWAIGGKGWGSKSNDVDAMAALERAWEIGVNIYDTCDAYGDGHSEELIGRFITDKRKETVIVTKGGTNFRLPERSKNFEKRYLMQCLDESLQRLKTDYIDVYLLHVPDEQWQEKEKVLDTLKEMKLSGKTRYVGLAMWGAKDTLHALSNDTDDVIEVLECPFNILNKSNVEVVKICKERNIGVLTSQPLASGILTGKYSVGTEFEQSDNRKGFWTKERWSSLENDLSIIKSCAEKADISMVDLALAYNLSYPGISCVIPGAKTPGQVEMNVHAAGMRLPENIMRTLYNTEGFVF
jgi:aryl-alcohol dehydrogenase-like predicted oxidoreductase